MNGIPGSNGRPLRSARALLACAACAAASLALGGCAAQPRAIPASPRALATEAAPAPLAPAARARTPEEIAARAMRSVVAIRGPRGAGAGFIVRRRGWIATSYHVIAGQGALVVTIPERGELPVVEVIAADAARDLAIVRVDAEDLPVLRLGDSAAVREGEPVIAVGRPQGLEEPVSRGQISDVQELSGAPTLFHVSAPIVPGSSGAPLLDRRGRVIGISNATVNRWQNVHYGVPVTYLREAILHPSPMPFAAFVESQRVPLIEREVPTHEVAILDGCSEGDLALLRDLLRQAIRDGAATYARGDYGATSRSVEQAAVEAEQRLGAACARPRALLEEARQAAAQAGDPKTRAWALRDRVDGVLDVLRRRLEAAAPE